MNNGASSSTQKPLVQFLKTLFESIETNEGELSHQALLDKISLAAILSSAEDAQEINALVSTHKQTLLEKLNRTTSPSSSASSTAMFATAGAAYAIRTKAIPEVTKLLAKKGVPFAINFIPGVGPVIAPMVVPAVEFSAELGLHILSKYCERIEVAPFSANLPQAITRQFQNGLSTMHNSLSSLVPQRLRAQATLAAAPTAPSTQALLTADPIASLAAVAVNDMQVVNPTTVPSAEVAAPCDDEKELPAAKRQRAEKSKSPSL